MPDTTDDIDIKWLLDYLSRSSNASFSTISSVSAYICHDALTALVAERDALRKRVAELEAKADDRDRDLRERLVCAALTGLNSNPDFTENADVLPRWAINQADQVLAAMRKGESDGK